MVGLTLVLIATVLYGVVIGVRCLWSWGGKHLRGHGETAEPRREPEGEYRFE
jgi:hypothetical protein